MATKGCCRSWCCTCCAVSAWTDGAKTARAASTCASLDRDQVSVKLNRDWPALLETARRRRSAAEVLLQHLREQLEPGVQGADLLVETTLGKLLKSIESDLELRSWVRDPRKLLDRAPLWLHEQEVIRLNKGLRCFAR